MESGDQVLPCAVCQQSTIHRPRAGDGWLMCQQCAARTLQLQGIPQAVPKSSYIRIRTSLLVLVTILVVVLGFAHVVHGGGVGLRVCAKDGWSLGDTIVDLDDFVGKPLISQLDRAKVLRAMFACGVLQRPGSNAPSRGSRVSQMFREGKGDATKIKLLKYAYEAYPSWSATHPDKPCPERLTDLNEYVNESDSNDEWGQPLKMMCGQTLPPGARGIAVTSAGEDGREGTPDDLKSWQ